jgi:hypothetical protein
VLKKIPVDISAPSFLPSNPQPARWELGLWGMSFVETLCLCVFVVRIGGAAGFPPIKRTRVERELWLVS